MVIKFDQWYSPNCLFMLVKNSLCIVLDACWQQSLQNIFVSYCLNLEKIWIQQFQRQKWSVNVIVNIIKAIIQIDGYYTSPGHFRSDFLPIIVSVQSTYLFQAEENPGYLDS